MLKQVSRLPLRRLFATTTESSSEAEQQIVSKLKDAFKDAKKVQAEDISGGCGSMYKVLVETSQFAGKTKVKQHKMVTDALKDDIKKWHGIVIETKA